MNRPEWWERVLAAVIDGLVVLIPALIIYVIFGLLSGGNLAIALIMNLLAAVIVTAGIVAYKVILESGPKQATLGKMVFGLQVVAVDTGGRMTMQQAVIRTWPWWLNLASFLSPVPILGVLISVLIFAGWIALLVMVTMDPNGQGLHDKMARAMIVKSGKGFVGQ
ncbi:MAG: RDD family protein [Rhodospirillaceae bacterium]|nr:RDD family protein [Rhodospirillaceae bacterium]